MHLTGTCSFLTKRQDSFKPINLMKKHLFFTLMVVFTLGMLTSCQYDFYVPELPDIDPEVDVSFSQEITPIFSAKCLNCHGGNIPPDLRPENAYASIVPARVNLDVPNDSKIYTKPLPDGSHAAKYSDAEAALILTWIEQGAKNN